MSVHMYRKGWIFTEISTYSVSMKLRKIAKLSYLEVTNPGAILIPSL